MFKPRKVQVDDDSSTVFVRSLNSPEPGNDVPTSRGPQTYKSSSSAAYLEQNLIDKPFDPARFVEQHFSNSKFKHGAVTLLRYLMNDVDNSLFSISPGGDVFLRNQMFPSAGLKDVLESLLDRRKNSFRNLVLGEMQFLSIIDDAPSDILSLINPKNYNCSNPPLTCPPN